MGGRKGPTGATPSRGSSHSVPLLAAGKYSPRAARLIRKRIVKSLFFFKVMTSFLKKRESRC